MLRLGVCFSAALALLGCNEEDTFTIGREREVCEGNVPTACQVSGRCVLDGEHYLAGSFPEPRRFVVRTDGAAVLNFQLLLTNRKTPGTELRVRVAEPSCASMDEYDSAGQDLFRLAGSDGFISVKLRVTKAGDHLVEVYSDAYCDYFLKVDL